MDAWEAGKFAMLVQETERDMKTFLATKQGGTTPEERYKIFNRKMLEGNPKAAVLYLADKEKGGILMASDIDEKTGASVATVLESKHPEARTPDASHLHTYTELPEFVDIDITDETVEKVAHNLSGSAGLGGTDAKALQHWLLYFGSTSKALRVALAEFASWMSNEFPPWAAYRALMTGRLLAIDKKSRHTTNRNR
jgi:hypothetical protein